ncbi:MAG: hypothetical protein GX982_00220 [Tissierellia bacterium]|nr:hypothetical protein [Tissierellia bacterium]
MKNLVSSIPFFKDKSILKLENLNNNFTVVKTDIGDYKLEIINANTLLSMESKKNWFDQLKSLDENVNTIIDVGQIENKTYSIKEYVKNDKYCVSNKEQYELGKKFGTFLKKLHVDHLEEGNCEWSKIYNYKIDLVIHEYGIGEYRGRKDYILLDYLEENRYLLNQRESTNILYLKSFADVVMSKEGKIDFDLFDKSYIADPYFEFRNISLSNHKIEYFILGVLKSYFGEYVPRSFFKILALYTIVEAWGEIFKSRKEIHKDVVNLKTEEIMSYYDDFSTIRPIWYDRALEELNNERE